MEILREQNVASYAVIPLVDAANRPSYKSNPTLAAGDVKIIRHTGGSWNVSNIGTLPSAISGATAQLLVTFTATELNPDDTKYPIIVQFIDQTSPKEWDDQEVIIWTRPAVSNMKQISDDSTAADNLEAIMDGTGAQMTLTKLAINAADAGGAIDIQNSAGPGIDIDITGTGVNAIDITANGAGAGIKVQAGATGEGIRVYGGGTSGDGLKITSTSGNGAYIEGGASGNGIYSSGGAAGGHGIHTKAAGGGDSGIRAEGNGGGSGIYGLGGSAGHGAALIGGNSSGHGLFAQAPNNGNGIYAFGVGSNAGLKAQGGPTGNGMDVIGGSTSGKGINVSTTDGHGISVAATSGQGVYIESSQAGVEIYCNTGNYPGVLIGGSGTGAGIEVQGGETGRGVWIKGGNTSGDAVSIDTTSGVGVDITNAAGIGINVSATGGNGISIASNQKGIYVSTTGSYGFEIAAQDDGLRITSTAGHGIYAGAGSNCDGMQLNGTGSGHGLSLIGGITGKDIDANEIDNIDTGVNNIEAKLPTNYIMGSSVQTDKDDEIDAIKAVTDNLPNSGALTDIDTGVNNIEAKLPSKSYLTGTANSDGDIELNDATGALPSGAFANHPNVGLNDDAITASKFDETTAYPLTSADTGSTAVARTGADGDTLETLSDQIDGVQSSVDGIQNNTRFVATVPTNMLIPDTGTKMYKITAHFYDTDGNMEDPDNNEIDILYEGVDGTDKDAFFDDASGSTPATAGTIDSNMWKMVKISTGVYETYYKLPSTETQEQWIASFKLEESSALLQYARTTNIVEENPGSVTLADNTTNADIIAEAMKERDVSGTGAVSGSVYKDIMDNIDANETKIDTVDSVVDDIKAVTDNLPNSGALTDIDTGVNNIEAKLPTNYIMGSSVQSDKDDEIDSIKSTVEGLNDLSSADVQTACDAAITANSDINNIDTGVNNIEAKLPSKSYLAGTNNSDGDIELNEATGALPSGAFANHPDVDLNADQSAVTIGTVNALGAQAKLDVNAEVDTALSDIGLDHLLSVAVTGTDVTDNSVFAKIASKSATADWDTFDNTTDSLEALRDNQAAGGLTAQQVRDAMKLAPTGGAPAAGSIDTHLDDIQTVTDALPNAGALTDIDTGVNNIEAKLPTNYIMGSSVQTDKDDEINAIKAVTDNLPNSGALTDIDTGVNNIEAKLPSKSYLAGTANADGDIQLDEATGAFVVGAYANHPAVNLNDDAITASKFDETTAYPLTSADTGSTAVARTGADGDTLETLSDQIDSVQTSVNGIQNNTKFVATVPTYMIIPAAGNTMYKITAHFYDSDGNMEDPDNNEIDILYENVSGGDKDAFFDDAGGTTPATAGVIDANMWKMVKISTGVYETYYKIPNTESEDQWTATFKLEESSTLLNYSRSTNVLAATPGTTTLADNTTNKDIIAEALKERDVSGTGAVSGSIYKDINDNIDANETKIDTIDTNVDTIVSKLPTNYIMGSSDQSDKDDEIDAIVAQLGSGVDLGDGTSITEMLTAIAGKTSDAGSYDRTTDSQEAIRDNQGSGAVDANVVSIDGQATNGNNATLNLKQLNIQNSDTDAPGILVRGNGAGAGIDVQGGITGNGIDVAGGSTSGEGIDISTTNGVGVLVTPGGTSKVGIKVYGSSSGGDAVHLSNHPTQSGSGLSIFGNGAYNAINISCLGGSGAGIGIFGGTNQSAIKISGNGTGAGIEIAGGATGHGIEVAGGSTSGKGIDITTTNGQGVSITAGGSSGIGISVNSQGAGIYVSAGNGGAGGTAMILACNSDGYALKLDGASDNGGSLYINSRNTGSIPAVKIDSNSTGKAIEIKGGSTSGHGIDISTTDGNGMNIIANSSAGNIGIYTEGKTIGIQAQGETNGIWARSYAVIPPSGAGFKATGNGGPGIEAEGEGSFAGIYAKGGSTGPGFHAVGGNSSGSGIKAEAVAAPSGHGIEAIGVGSGYCGIYAQGDGTGAGIRSKGGTTGPGFHAVGGDSSGSGIKAEAVAAPSGHGIEAIAVGSGYHGFYAKGDGSGSGAKFEGGATGNGINIVGGSTSGNGINISATDGNGIKSVGGNSGAGAYFNSDSTGAGIEIVGGPTSGHGISINTVNGNGVNINAAATAGNIGIYTKGKAIGLKSEGETNGIYALTASAGPPASGAGFKAEGYGGPGIEALGEGAYAGIYSKGGATGNGLEVVGGSTSGNGINISATDGHGIISQAGGNNDGLRLWGSGTESGLRLVPGITGYGAYIQGSPSHPALNVTGGPGQLGLYIQGGSGAAKLEAIPSGIALELKGNGANSGLKVEGGATGNGVEIVGGSTSGMGIDVSTTDGYGIYVGPGGTKRAIQMDGGVQVAAGESGDALTLIADPGNYSLRGLAGAFIQAGPNQNGLLVQGNGSGHGFSCVKGTTGKDIDADEIDAILPAISAIDIEGGCDDALNAYDSGNGVARQSSVDSIQNNTRFVATIPSYCLIPVAGSNIYKLQVHFYDSAGNMEDPDLNEKETGTNTSTGTNKLYDTLATFQTNGVQIGDVVYNDTDLTEANVTVVNGEDELTLDADIFTGTGKTYRVGMPEFSIDLETANGTDKNALLYKEFALSNALDNSVKFSGYKELEREAKGIFFCYMEIVNTENEAQFMYDFACEEGSVALHYSRTTLVLEEAPEGVINANLVSIDDELTSGNNATLNLKQLNIYNDGGAAIIATSDTTHAIQAVAGTNGDAINLTGAGNGAGLFVGGGDTGHALEIAAAVGNGIDISTTDGHGIDIAVGANNNNGINVTAMGGSGSSGIKVTTLGTGIGVTSVGYAVSLDGGMLISGGTDATGLVIQGNGIGNGITVEAGSTGVGLSVLGGSTSGDAVRLDSVLGRALFAKSQNANGDYAVEIQSLANGGGLACYGNNGIGLDIGTSGAGIPAIKVFASAGNGALIEGGSGGTYNGLRIESNSGAGISVQAVGGHAFHAEVAGGGSFNGIHVQGFNAGAGMRFEGGVVGSGIEVIGGSSDGYGLNIQSQAGDKAGFIMRGNGTGKDIDAAEINNVTSEILGMTIDGTATFSVAMRQILAYCGGNINRAGSVYTYRNYDDNADVMVISGSAAGRTRS